ncbi:phosducin-like protein 3 [Helianthus annuus]|nr:phosducin-like protein 3 [Helianthus annuus]XP_035840096.1 phosducin-like protein 3 [Helianthus annuus]KAJ0472132.1 putative phosducin, thioredoxin-like domain, Thioredoxin-like superfamily [Helianthus annuus]
MVVVQNAIKHSGDVGEYVRESKLLERERESRETVGGSRRSLGFRQSSLLSDQDSGESDKLAEMKQDVKIAKFGSIIPISGSNFVHEVSQASSDVWVVVVLYKDGYPECGVLMQCVKELATVYPATKFVQILSTDCIPNYPDCNLPTVLV